MKNLIAASPSLDRPPTFWARHISPAMLMLGTAWLARLALIAILPEGAYSDDVRSWSTVARTLFAGENP